jgi:hypothetical protein
VQCKLGFIETPVKNIGHGLKTSVDGGLNKVLLAGRGAMKNKVGNLLRKSKAAWVSNTKPKPPEIGRAKVLGDAANAIVPAVTTTFF